MLRKVSIATIQKALEELEIVGLVKAKPKSGCYECFSRPSEVMIELPRVAISKRMNESGCQIRAGVSGLCWLFAVD